MLGQDFRLFIHKQYLYNHIVEDMAPIWCMDLLLEEVGDAIGYL